MESILKFQSIEKENNYLEHDDLFGKISLQDFDPLNFEKPATIRSSDSKKTDCRLTNFLENLESFLETKGITDVVPRGIPDDQKLSVIFYKLFKAVDVPTIDSIYLTARDHGIPIPEPVYEILKVCRLSYHGSVILFKEIGDHTKFHEFYYDNVLQQALNVLKDSQERNLETFADFQAVFMGARYHNIPLSGRIINRALFAIAKYQEYQMLPIVLGYGLKQDVTVSCISETFRFFKETPEVYRQFYEFFVTHTGSSFLEENMSQIINKLIINVVDVQEWELLIELLQYLIEKQFFLNIEALDAMFGSQAPNLIENFLENIADSLLDRNEPNSYNDGPFSKALWEYFEKLISENNYEKTFGLLVHLAKTDVNMIEKEFLHDYYTKLCEAGLDDNTLLKIRGFIQSFGLL